MFVLRSAVWLTLAFIVIRPETDFRDAASSLSAEAMARGSQFVAQQIDAIACENLQCHGGKAIAAAALSAGMPVVVANERAVPHPRPRPDRAV